MYVVFLTGGIASGKSTVSQELKRLGACSIDLDQISRDVLSPGTETTRAVAEAFGEDVLDPVTGELRRALLAQRAFATHATAELLERIELPAIEAQFVDELTAMRGADNQPACCVVEVQLLDRVGSALDFADEVLLVDVPLAERRKRAVARGMTEADFDARAANQPSDAWLRAHADTIITNNGTLDELLAAVGMWWNKHEEERWTPLRANASSSSLTCSDFGGEAGESHA